MKLGNSRNSNKKSLLFQTNSSDSSIQTVFSLSNFKPAQKSLIWTIKRAKYSRIDEVTVMQSLMITAKLMKNLSILCNLLHYFHHFSSQNVHKFSNQLTQQRFAPKIVRNEALLTKLWYLETWNFKKMTKKHKFYSKPIIILTN